MVYTTSCLDRMQLKNQLSQATYLDGMLSFSKTIVGPTDFETFKERKSTEKCLNYNPLLHFSICIETRVGCDQDLYR